MSQEVAELVANYGEAIGTLSAVGVALFLQVYLVNKRRPAIHVTFSEEVDDEDIVYTDDLAEGEFKYYLRVKVWALPKRRAAKSVQASLLRVTRPVRHRKPTTRVRDGMLKWSGPSIDERVDIAPGTWRRLDLLRCEQHVDDQAPIMTPGLIRPPSIIPWPPAERSRLTDSGQYDIDFAVSSDDGDATFWRLTFTLELPEEGAQRLSGPLVFANQIKRPTLSRIEAPRIPMAQAVRRRRFQIRG